MKRKIFYVYKTPETQPMSAPHCDIIILNSLTCNLLIILSKGDGEDLVVPSTTTTPSCFFLHSLFPISISLAQDHIDVLFVRAHFCYCRNLCIYHSKLTFLSTNYKQAGEVNPFVCWSPTYMVCHLLTPTISALPCA